MRFTQGTERPAKVAKPALLSIASVRAPSSTPMMLPGEHHYVNPHLTLSYLAMTQKRDQRGRNHLAEPGSDGRWERHLEQHNE